MRTLLIGDVHGCAEELEQLLRACEVGAGDDVICVGDLVAKGPDSQGVVQLLREAGHSSVVGNHDDYVLRLRRGGRTPSKPPKADHLRVLESLKPADWEYLEALPALRRVPEHDVVVVHAGVVPGVALEDQQREHLLTLRSITADGLPSKKALEGTPWGSHWKGPSHVVFGHDALRGLQQHPFATGLDTGCVYGGELTALILPERRLVRVKARRAYSPRGG